MRLTSPSVQRLLNASERTLVESASASVLKELSEARLRGKVDRARGLKDKYAGLARTRGRTERGKAAPRAAARGADRETLAAKAEVFDVVLTRFLGQLAKLAKKTARPAKTSATRSPKPAVRTAKKTAAQSTKQTAKKTAKKTAKQTAKKTAKKAAATKTAAKRVVKKTARPVAKTTAKRVAKKAAEPPPQMTKGEAREIVEKVRRRVALKAGFPAAAMDDVEAPSAVPDAVDAEITSAEAHDFHAQRADVEHALAVSHLTRAQGFAASNTQRAQGRRDR